MSTRERRWPARSSPTQRDRGWRRLIKDDQILNDRVGVPTRRCREEELAMLTAGRPKDPWQSWEAALAQAAT